MDDDGDLVTTRLASLCLRRGRPRRLTFDDHLVRAALAVDLTLGGALSEVSWAGGLAVDALLTVGTHTRAVGIAVD